MKNKSIIGEAEDIQRAAEMVRLGARMQMLEAETQLSRERLLKIYKEVRGMSPPKGMLPFSTDWFMTWQPNVHASLFKAFQASSARRPACRGWMRFSRPITCTSITSRPSAWIRC
jgi:flagellar transcriptional activator FlhC